MSTVNLGHHISSRFNEDLERVRSRVLEMGGLVEQQLNHALSTLVEGAETQLVQIGDRIAIEEDHVNKLELTIDEDCSRILATRIPAAGDLRLIIGILKTITDLERIGD